jgi:hypothetical protein
MTAKAKAETKTKQKTREIQDQEKLKGDRQMHLDGALGDSFPASDPPSITQPGRLKPGGPERNQSSRRDSRSR